MLHFSFSGITDWHTTSKKRDLWLLTLVVLIYKSQRDLFTKKTDFRCNYSLWYPTARFHYFHFCFITDLDNILFCYCFRAYPAGNSFLSPTHELSVISYWRSFTCWCGTSLWSIFTKDHKDNCTTLQKFTFTITYLTWMSSLKRENLHLGI